MIDAPARPTMQPLPDDDLETWRCAGCRRIVAKVANLRGHIEVLCKCGTMNCRDIR